MQARSMFRWFQGGSLHGLAPAWHRRCAEDVAGYGL